MNPVNILFDGKGLQAQAQQVNGTRLTSLLSSFDAAGFTYGFSDVDGTISSTVLDGYDILAITSRYLFHGSNPDSSFYYTSDELSAIVEFVQAGNGLLLMSNHANFNVPPANNPNDITIYDIALAQQFGVTIEKAAFYGAGTMSGDLLSSSSPIITGGTGVGSIVVNDCTSLSCAGATVIAQINPAMTDGHSPTIAPSGQIFALSLSGVDAVGSGRAVFTGDSGFIGNCPDDDPNKGNEPGPGQYCQGDNGSFMLNVMSWLAGNL